MVGESSMTRKRQPPPQYGLRSNQCQCLQFCYLGGRIAEWGLAICWTFCGDRSANACCSVRQGTVSRNCGTSPNQLRFRFRSPVISAKRSNSRGTGPARATFCSCHRAALRSMNSLISRRGGTTSGSKFERSPRLRNKTGIRRKNEAAPRSEASKPKSTQESGPHDDTAGGGMISTSRSGLVLTSKRPRAEGGLNHSVHRDNLLDRDGLSVNIM